MQIVYLNKLSNSNDCKAKVMKYMTESQEKRKLKVFDVINTWQFQTILKEFKHFLSYQGEVVSNYSIY